MNFTLGCDALNIDIHGFSIQFRYKIFIILRRSHEKLREKKFPASPSRKTKLPPSSSGRKLWKYSSWILCPSPPPQIINVSPLSNNHNIRNNKKDVLKNFILFNQLLGVYARKQWLGICYNCYNYEMLGIYTIADVQTKYYAHSNYRQSYYKKLISSSCLCCLDYIITDSRDNQHFVTGCFQLYWDKNMGYPGL